MYGCKILCDSITPMGARLTTFEVTLPRIVLAEFNTHRVFSRNSASSRAIPVATMRARVKDDPFVPDSWGKNQKGMQAEEDVTPEDAEKARAQWLLMRDDALEYTARLQHLGIHKQITNRLLEPWLWHPIIVTATEWRNFFALRDSPMAQPEIRTAAHWMREEYKKSTPQLLQPGSWHLPLVTGVDHDLLVFETFNEPHAWHETLARISSARCARVSHLLHDGKRDPQADLGLCRNLTIQGHMSPLEHPARALSKEEWEEKGRKAAERWVKDRVPMGNFWGWEQFRKTIPNEHDFPREDLFGETT